MATLEFSVLGPFEVRVDGEPVQLRGGRQWALLALLLLNANKPVTIDALIEALWPERPPDTAPNVLQVYVSRLRKALGDTLEVKTHARAYELRVEPEQLDLDRFERFMVDGRAADALALWRGQPLGGLEHEPFAPAEIERLEELRLDALEQCADEQLRSGDGDGLVRELEPVARKHPHRERLVGQLMLALYRADRQADSLDLYARTRRRLAEDLGIEPGSGLKDLERAVLRQDPALDAPSHETSNRALRKTVTVVASIATGSGDAETRSRTLAPRVAQIRELFEQHGGRAEDVLDDTVIAVFGVPSVREDDAARALRATEEIVAAVDGVRTGAATGEIITGPGGATGEVFEEAVALARAAADGTATVSPVTQQLARGVPRRLDAPLIGRGQELAQLLASFERAESRCTAHLVSVLGDAGIGKSRLARELAACLEGRADVLTGRCLSYGGATLWPLAELLRRRLGDDPAAAIAELVGDADEAAAVTTRIVSFVGADRTEADVGETLWALRRLFAALGRKQALVVVLDDVHWASHTLLDVVDRLADTRGSPLLLLCLARLELLEARPGWGGGKANATAMLLEPLSAHEAESLVEALVDEERVESHARSQIVESAGGNPLFIEHMASLVTEAGDLELPSTMQTLLEARLDRLPSAEREVLESASVIGKEFAHEALALLVRPELESELAAHLESLADRNLLDRAPGESFRFHHLLVRDAAYRSVPKQRRAELHERFAAWIEARPGRQGRALDEVVGYHLEQAYRYRRELGAGADDTRELARHAGRLLGDAGRRACARGEVAAAVGLLERAESLLRDDGARLDVLADLGDALREAGDLDRSADVLGELYAAATAAGVESLAAHADVVRARVRMQRDPAFSMDELAASAEAAIDVLGRIGDERRLAAAWFMFAQVPWYRCRGAETEAALDHAIEHARHSGDERALAWSLNLLLASCFFGPKPVSEGIALCDAVRSKRGQQRRIVASAARTLAGLRAMQGAFDEAAALVAQDKALVDELGLRVIAGVASELYGTVHLLAGDAAAAERELRAGYQTLEAMGEASVLSNVAGLLARSLVLQERDEEALSYTSEGERLAAVDDLAAGVHWRGPRARVLARRGAHVEAAALAREAVELAARTDFLNLHGDALVDLAEVLRAGGRPAEAEAADADAVILYERKGNSVAALGRTGPRRADNQS